MKQIVIFINFLSFCLILCENYSSELDRTVKILAEELVTNHGDETSFNISVPDGVLNVKVKLIKFRKANYKHSHRTKKILHDDKEDDLTDLFNFLAYYQDFDSSQKKRVHKKRKKLKPWMKDVRKSRGTKLSFYPEFDDNL